MFTYWTSSSLSVPESFPVWQARFPSFRLFGDDDVLHLLPSDELRTLYSQISLPACKSDIARLILLREYGGLYVDSHAGPADGDRLAETLDILSSYELVLFSKAWECKSETDFNLMNTALAARAHTALLDKLIAVVLENLAKQRNMEQQTRKYVPYHLFGLTGTGTIIECFYDQTKKPFDIKPEYRSKIFQYNMPTLESPGFKIYQFYGYRKPGGHWSERQQNELLFTE